MTSIAAVTSTEAADISAVPAIALGEEYNDNILLDPPSYAKKDFITHILPSIYARYDAPIWEWSIAYSYDYRSFARYSDANDYIQTLILLSTVRTMKDLLFLEVRDFAGSTSLSVTHDYTQEGFLKNQTQYNTLEVNPYAGIQLTSHMTLTIGYLYQNVWYSDPSAIDRFVNGVYGDLLQTVNDRTSVTANARQDTTKTQLNTRTRTSYLFGSRYEYQEGCFLWGKIGRSTKTYEDGRSVTDPIWNGGIHHRMPTVILTFETARSWVEDPLLGDRREDRYVAAMRIGQDSLRIGQERTSGGVSFLARYYGVDQYNVERKYTTIADFSHFLTEKLQGKYALTIDQYKFYPVDAPDTMTIVYNTDVRFDHHATENLILSLSYRYTNSYSPDVYVNNYKVNRVLAEIKKSF